MKISKLYDFIFKRIIILVLICIYKVNSFPNFEKSNEIKTVTSSENDNDNFIEARPLLMNENKNIQINYDNDNYLAKYAKNMKNYLNTSIDPCDDFYEYACGNWEKYNPRPEGLHKLTVFKTIEMDIVEKVRNLLTEDDDDDKTNNTDSDGIYDGTKAKIYYKSCLSRSGVEPLLEYFDTVLGGWPALNENWNNNTELDWINLTISASIFTSALVDIYYTVDMKNSLENAMYIDEPELGLINAKYYLDESKSDKVTAYKNLIIDCLTILGASKDISLKTAEEIIELEKKLAKAMRDPNERVDDEDQYHLVTIDELMSNYSDVNWKRLIEVYYEQSVELNQTVIVCSPEFIGPFTELISNTDMRVITNYICWRIASEIIMTLDKRFENAFRNFKRELYGTGVIFPFWYNCVRETMYVTKRSVTTMFIRKYFNGTSRAGLIELTEYLKYSFLEIIKESDWLDDETKTLAIKKLNYTRLEVGYPDSYLEPNQSFEEFDFKEDKYFNNYRQYRMTGRLHGIDELIISKILDAWELVNPITVDAYHVKITNQIIFPAGILQPPMYHPDFPEAIKFGVIGSYIGHELTHGFDDVGRKYDYLGRMQDWWNENSTKNFLERAKCYIEQYNSYKIQGHHINGEFSLGENIADNGGIIQSYRAYKNWLLQHDNYEEINLPGIDFNGSQLFFLSYAQSWCFSITPESLEIALVDDKHTPGNIRMIGAVRNVPEFAKAFNCPLGSFMNPVEKCKLW